MLTLCVASSVAMVHVRVDRRDFLGAAGMTTGAAAATICCPDSALVASASAAPTKNNKLGGPLPPYSWKVVPGVGSSRRAYAFVTFANGARGIVCSDEDTQRCEIAATVACGSLNDPIALEGLAHLSEHVTLASDPQNLAGLIDELQGEVNAFTAERTTTFYAGFDVNKRVTRTASADLAESAIDAARRKDVAEAAKRFAALFTRALTDPPSIAAPAPVIQNEMGRVDAELDEITRSPSLRLLEVAALKARAAEQSPWRRLGRGGKDTLYGKGAASLWKDGKDYAVVDYMDTSLSRLANAVAAIRTECYLPEDMTVAAVTPLPLAEAVPLLGNAFGAIPPAPSEAAKGSFASDNGATPAALRVVSTPFPDLGRAAGGAWAVKRPGRRCTLTLAWEVEVEDPTAEQRMKPLDLVGHALTEPHKRSLSSILRARGLSPLEVEMDPILRACAVARADGWVIWQVEVVLLPNVRNRWREAAALTIAAVDRLAKEGVPESSIEEAMAMSEATWQFAARQPSAVELATDLQLEPTAELAVTGARTFVGSLNELRASANRAAAQLAARSPITTVWSSRIDNLGVDSRGDRQQLPPPLESAVELAPLSLQAEAASAAPYAYVRATELLPAPPNIQSSRPASASPRQAARAELWRLTLLQALALPRAAASRGGLRCEVSFNTDGMRLLVSGYSQRLPKLMALLLRTTLRHVPPPAGSAEFMASRRVGLAALQARGTSGEQLLTMERASPQQIQAEVTELFRLVEGASLLLAGDISDEAAASLAAIVRRELTPLLPAAAAVTVGHGGDLSSSSAANDAIASATAVGEQQRSLQRGLLDDELRRWSGRLYKPGFPSGSVCQDPAIARALDQCGSI